MKRELAGKRAIVTGASSGIGKAVATAMAKAGAKVIFAARNSDKLAAAIQGLPNAVAVSADVTIPDDRNRIINSAVERFGGLDILVNNAGIGAWGHFISSTEAINRQVMETNFFAPTELTRLAIPLLERGEQPCIVNITSMCGRRGMPAWPEYSASKFALVGLGESLRGELVRFGIDVVTIVPGLTDSDYRSHLIRNDGKAKIDFEKGMAPEYVAEKVLAATKAGKRELVLGGEAKWMLRMNRWLPKLTNRLIARKVRKLYEQR
jgi:NAD(P)-dependent dehydrogenase (short-subunit alcohol dehydrogenase family)